MKKIILITFIISSTAILALVIYILVKNVGLFNKKEIFPNKQKSVKYIKTIGPSFSNGLVGQVGGVAAYSDEKLLVFHRGSRIWSSDSFILNNFNRLKYGAIKEQVLALIDAKNSTMLESWGEDMFYMPHGIEIDHEGNVWITDVALHQVLKFDLKISKEPQFVLGLRFKLGADEKRFCKPTDVAVSKTNGDIFVSDGYCNKRIVHFKSDGTFIKEFKDNQKPLFIAHSITLVEKLNLVCTVSREEGRIVCFDIDSGEKRYEIVDSNMLTVYAIKYDSNNEILHAVTGKNNEKKGTGLTFSADESSFGKFLESWNIKDMDLKEVHDIDLSPDGSQIYLGQLNGELNVFVYE